MNIKNATEGAGVKAQQVKLPPVMPTSRVVHVLDALIQLLADGLGNAAENDPNVGTTAAHGGDPDEAPGFWLLPRPALVTVVL